jgi:hypothetical protein
VYVGRCRRIERVGGEEVTWANASRAPALSAYTRRCAWRFIGGSERSESEKVTLACPSIHGCS